MSNVEVYEASQGMELISGIRALLAQAETVEDLADIRDQAEAVRILASKRDAYKSIELEATEVVRRVERQMAELVIELKEAGKVRKGGRPKKAATDSQDIDGNPATDSQVSARELFGDDKAQTAAYQFAQVDDDAWNEALADARAAGDMSRRALVKRLGAGARADGAGNGDITPIAQVMAAVFRNLAAVVDRLNDFDPATIEHDDRKEWKARLAEYAVTIDTWRKALPR